MKNQNLEHDMMDGKNGSGTSNCLFHCIGRDSLRIVGLLPATTDGFHILGAVITLIALIMFFCAQCG